MIWPLPAFLAWAMAWTVFAALKAAGGPAWAAFAAGVATGLLGAAAAALRGATRWRQAFIALGFPLSAAASGWTAGVPAWAWLAPLALLLALYPLRSWRDAPLFPTPVGALSGLAKATGLPAQARLMDAGCGLGDGLLALRAEFPQAALAGLEWSWPLSRLCSLRCRLKGARAQVRRGDIWAEDWSGHDLVYLFQRPESMDRAMRKAGGEMRAGSWLASLEFEAVGWKPAAKIEAVPGKPVWLYRLPPRRG